MSKKQFEQMCFHECDWRAGQKWATFKEQKTGMIFVYLLSHLQCTGVDHAADNIASLTYTCCLQWISFGFYAVCNENSKQMQQLALDIQHVCFHMILTHRDLLKKPQVST